MPNEEKLNLRVLRNNISLSSSHFRHAIRITIALLLGYYFHYFGNWTYVLDFNYHYSYFKTRLLHYQTEKSAPFYGTVAAVIAYGILHFIHIKFYLPFFY
jgi:hypothetical protein